MAVARPRGRVLTSEARLADRTDRSCAPVVRQLDFLCSCLRRSHSASGQRLHPPRWRVVVIQDTEPDSACFLAAEVRFELNRTLAGQRLSRPDGREDERAVLQESLARWRPWAPADAPASDV